MKNLAILPSSNNSRILSSHNQHYSKLNEELMINKGLWCSINKVQQIVDIKEVFLRIDTVSDRLPLKFNHLRGDSKDKREYTKEEVLDQTMKAVSLIANTTKQ
jgi:hypothetical protein